jgi:diacylglycerol kinase family enzyme
MRAAVIYHAGRVKLERLQPLVDAREAAEGWQPSLWLPMVAGEPSSVQVDVAAHAGVDLVIAAGGDGTVRGVGSATRAHGLPFAVVPIGTANLLARNLGLPLLDAEAAVRIAFTGSTKRIDLGVLDYRLEDGTEASRGYLVMAGFGIDADMVAGTDKRLKRSIGWVAYVGPIVWAMRPRRGVALQVSVDGATPTDQQLHSVFLGNCGIITAGIRLLPDALMDDGLLDLLTIRNVASWVRRRSLRGYAVDAPGGSRRREFSYTTARTVELTMSQPAQFQADGDSIGLVTWARASILPLALAVRVP